MNEMLKKAALAVADQLISKCGGIKCIESRHGCLCLDQARAVIQSLREPTDDMLIAGLTAGAQQNKKFAERLEDAKAFAASIVSTGDGRLYKVSHQAMMDAALKDG